jgi:hypothetical protein
VGLQAGSDGKGSTEETAVPATQIFVEEGFWGRESALLAAVVPELRACSDGRTSTEDAAYAAASFFVEDD